MKKLIAYLRMIEAHRIKASIYTGSAGPLT
jgi:hypothetical protein